MPSDGECYFYFDPKSALATVKELYYEWNKKTKTLKMFGKLDGEFTIGSDVAIVSGKEIKLKEPVGFEDGMPLLPASVYAEIIGHKIVKHGNVLEFVK